MHQPTASNAIGLWTLYMREVRRFMKVYTQTMLAPVVTTLLFLAVFSLALGQFRPDVHGVPFSQFLAPGLVMMAIAQNAFANTSSSIMIAKVQGNIVDTLMPPFTPTELVFGIAMGGVTRGICVGLAVTVAMSFAVGFQITHVGMILFHAFAASLMLALLGIIAGIWAEKFDHMAAVTNFIITPLAFLSGTFYSIERLPELGQTLAHFNPFFYMIDGFRSGFIGHADITPWVGMAVMVAIDIVLWVICTRMFKTGYKLKP
ncbi:ABC transporter permease [Rhodospirillales bacterium]|jgi:ABC-2 type transport system permease protein|nr:ABC transporter permease [Rhodospirillales bacterium]